MFTVYYLQVDGLKYVGRTTNFDRRKRDHLTHTGTDKKVYAYMNREGGDRYIRFEKLGDYVDISVTGWGSLQPRMEYLWYHRIKPELNNHHPGVSYYRRDKLKHEDVIGSYETFEKIYRTVSICDGPNGDREIQQASNTTSSPIFNMWKTKHESFIEEQEIMNTHVTTEPEAMAKVERIIDMILQVDTEIHMFPDMKLFITTNFNVMAFPSIAKWINDSDRLPKDNRLEPSMDGYPVMSYADHVCIDLLQKFENFKREMFHASPFPQIYVGELFSKMLNERGQIMERNT